MAKKKITLYLDIVSPFAYMGFYALQNFPVFKQCEITYVPIFLGGLMKACANTAPIQIKNKDKWIDIERLRWARQFNIPISESFPPNFPINTLPLQRTLTALQLHHPTHLVPALSALYNAFWVTYTSPTEPSRLLEILTSVLGIEEQANSVLDATKSDEVKKKLAANTDEAFEAGAFGLPWFVAENEKGEKEGFWGFDHLGQVVDFLGVERPVREKGWRALL